MLEIVNRAMSSLTTQRDSKPSGRNCCQCGGFIPLEPSAWQWRSLDVWCDACSDAAKKKAEAERVSKSESERAQALLEIPKAFLATVRERLPHPDKLDAGLAWKFGERGLLLYGPTGCGKSRVVWEIVKREIGLGRKVKAVTALELMRYPALMMTDFNEASKYAAELSCVPLLVLDDVFKAKPTERVEELLFAVIDERGQWGRPCLVTLNDTGESLRSRLSADRGPALIRRLREYCETIQF